MKLRKFWTKIVLMAVAASVLLPEIAMAKGKAAPLVVVAHTTKLTGIMAWWSKLYNENMLIFTVLTGCLVPLAGIVLGLLGDFLMSLTGIDLRKRELVEH